MATLTTDAIKNMLLGVSSIDPILQITSVDSIQHSSSTSTKYRVELSDGLHSLHALLPIENNIDVAEEALKKGTIVQLQEYTSKNFKNYTAIVIIRLAILHNSSPLVGAPTPLLQASAYAASTSSQDPSQSSQIGSSLSQEQSSCSQLLDGPALQLTPINTLTPYLMNWSIEGRALAKTKLREYQNAKGNGKVFGFDLVDKDGSEIHVTCFNEVADKFYDVVQTNSIYVISGARLEEAKKQYSPSTHPYQIFLTMSSIINASLSLEATIPMTISHIKSIDTLIYCPDKSLVDVIGILCFISTPSTLRRKDGTETKRCTINIMDISGFTIDITLWGHHCEVQGKQLFDMHKKTMAPIVLIKSGRLTSWQGKKIDCIYSTTIHINPELEEASILRAWYSSLDTNQPLVSISSNRDSTASFENPIKIGEIIGKNFPSKHNVCIKAVISKLYLDNFYYLSCPQLVDGKKCKKKVVRTSANAYNCPRCPSECGECDFSYVLKMNLQDDTGELLKATAFEEPANILLGVGVKDLLLLLAEPDAAHDVLDKVVNCQFLIQLSITMKNFSGKDLQSIVITAFKSI